AHEVGGDAWRVSQPGGGAAETIAASGLYRLAGDPTTEALAGGPETAAVGGAGGERQHPEFLLPVSGGGGRPVPGPSARFFQGVDGRASAVQPTSGLESDRR
ncbi:MAG: hypothetical protein ACK55I_07615, partial [bacterium]